MIEKIIIISLLVWAIWYTMRPGEIFGQLGDWFDKHLPAWLKSPVFDCPVCMCWWYGTALYWLIWANDWKEWITCVIAAMGLNVILTKLFPDKQ